MSYDDTPPPGPPATPRAASRRKDRRKSGKRHVGRWILIGLVVVVLAAGGTGWWYYEHLNGNLKGVDLSKQLDESTRPKKAVAAGNATNLLVLGSDSRSGDNGKLDAGNVSGARSDTALLVHIPEGRQKAVAVSIPRDTLVDRPECEKHDGGTLPAAHRVMFNSVYSLAGPACVVKTVEKMSDVRVDHLVEVDFAGFKGLVDAIGGVTVTTDEDIHDAKSGFDLPKGTHKLDGTDSLKFVRTRYGHGDGSDLGRIGLQQQFLLALLSEVKNQDLLGSPTKAIKMANSATKALTTDEDLASLTSLAKFARSMRGIDPNTMETIMMPVAYDKQDANRVVPAEPQAAQLWKAIRNDVDIPESAKKSPATGG
ncbi:MULTISPECIES: LCP family protein [Streptomyces]|uniref:LCP family protein n=1 Tax=Streptomyces evansiae TaxID=3075535 RepID=A0ABU2R2X0_9ACTN|nr:MULTISPECIES: LCP family protein [unclassified Streptomyces]MDT0410060.1 LCP family protein [Streptomyces sp. DSM 41979]MYQ61628.1 LytR family transcriptional regulator [Streptomyces sp. SID4926]WEH30427.1 LCP family protein [Streptomyces sp. AM 3-1-1]SCE55944.1 transcriptional attenuator, LytR family [Streptomyces sp. DfronAA-171]